MIWLVVFKRVAVDHETSGINEIRNLNDGRVAETRSGPAGGGRAASSGRWWLISGSREGGRERERERERELKAKECCGTNVLWPRSLTFARQVQKFLTIWRQHS